jgi:GDP-mannose transporter
MASAAALSSAATFAAASVAMTVFNKAVMNTFHFDAPLTLTALQAVATLVLLQVWALLWPKTIQLPRFSMEKVAKMAPLSLIFVLKLASSMVSLGRTNVPMFTSLRQTAVLFVVVEEWWYFGHWPSATVWGAIGLICGGAGLAALKDLTFDAGAYAFLFFANLFASLYAVNINATRKATGLDVVGLLAYNTWLTLPVLFMLAAVTGDLEKALAYPRLLDAGFLVVFLGAIFLSFILNLALFYCTTLTSATTKTVISGLKSIVTIGFGIALFDDYVYHPLNAAGLLLSFVGGVYYSSISFFAAASDAKPLAVHVGSGPHDTKTVAMELPTVDTPMPMLSGAGSLVFRERLESDHPPAPAVQGLETRFSPRRHLVGAASAEVLTQPPTGGEAVTLLVSPPARSTHGVAMPGNVSALTRHKAAL